ncbi:hypothetical protein M433DRAFT_56902 [Acidomyces richmondensis BFW]|nr:MAG: hypothetical protein FE78DRAFT_168330 [Acidomyces sp. 'richmondensis']KYG50599.1 hypothetical protein M433DRAFT_56902 [Acidomyces richmondensis BFW]
MLPQAVIISLVWSPAVLAKSHSTRIDKSSNIDNANHIFNAIQNSMRQFGSSLDHNGMSLFVAQVPADTEFYHGTSTPYRINGTEWLAFEPEHALMFARPFRGGPPRDFDISASQNPMIAVNTEEGRAHGYLHTYRTKHDLRLLYVDGQSAAKTNKGTLDVQDLEDDERRPRGPMGEAERALRLCRLAKEEWNDSIDGILRMEAGFEIILCDFAKHLDIVQIAETKEETKDHGPGGPFEIDYGEMINSFKAVAARYDGIGGERVSLNYENFVTLFAYDDAIVFDTTDKPRIKNHTAIIEPIRLAIKEMVLAQSDKRTKNWQAIADMVVSRYADRIAYLASGDIVDLDTFKAEIDRALRPYINYGDRNVTAEIARCSGQFLPSHTGNSELLAAKAIRNVSAVICRTLSAANEIDTLAHGISTIRGLKSWLAWPTFKKCRGCGVHEVCVIPIWPSGSKDDFDHPRCRSNLSQTHDSYWDGFRRRPRENHESKSEEVY